MANDYELERLFSEISILETELNKTQAEADNLKSLMNNAWESLRYFQEQYRYYKNLATEEFEKARDCYAGGDKESAKNHSIDGRYLNEKKNSFSSGIDNNRAIYESYKASYNRAKERKNSIIKQLKEKREAKNSRLAFLKEMNAEKQSHWHEKKCLKCGGIIKYNDAWTNVPNYCKECKEKLTAERVKKEAERKEKQAKWKEKPCKQCGTTIRYNIEWTNIPNYCESCKKKFKEEKENNYKLRFNPETGKNDFWYKWY